MKNFALKTVLFVCLFAGMTATAQTQAKLSHGEILEVRIIDGFDGKNVPQAINAVTREAQKALKGNLLEGLQNLFKKK